MRDLGVAVGWIVSILCCVSPARAIFVQLDPSFGNNGTVLTAIGPNTSSGTAAMAIQSDGKVVVVGTHSGTTDDIFVFRYNGDGSLDASFGVGGIVVTDFGAIERAKAVALQSDGKIVVAGHVYVGAFAGTLLRYNSDGTLDTSFDGDGEVRASNAIPSFDAVAVQGDGKIVVAGGGAVLRFNPDGTPDTTFDGDGVASGPSGSFGRSLAIQSDGKIVVAGNYVVRFNTDGSLDTGFNGSGSVAASVGNVTAGALQPDGKIVLVGWASNSNEDIVMVRFNSDGSLDSSFAGDGTVLTDFGGDENPSAVLIQTDGKIIVSGYEYPKLLVVRYNADGSIDTTFNGDGKVVATAVGSASAAALQSDGKLLVAANAFLYDAALLRYLITCGDGNVDGPAEQCDDGNAINGDGCDSNCTFSACGNGVQGGAEECDDGNAVDGDGCDSNCTITACLNGIQTAGEACDDGNHVNGDGCDNNCTPTGCGNNIVTSGEACDDGNNINGDGCESNCQPSVCGNGIPSYGRQCIGVGCTDECDSGWTSTFAAGVTDVFAFAEMDGNLVAGGLFATVEGAVTDGVALWDGSAWSPLGTGIAGEIYALASSGNVLYAGGIFAAASSVPAANIAKWDGSTWSALGSGVNAGVLALYLNGSDLYAGGGFTTAGGLSADHVAKWNGSAWSALGTGVDGQVMALAVIGTDLYAGGLFANAGGAPAANIAKWDGSAWAALGGGTPDQVNALAVLDGDLYAAGPGFVRKWDGVSWSPLGTVGSAEVKAIMVSGDSIYIGGSFSDLNGSSAPNLARWDGTAWFSLGSGANDEVRALASNGGALFTAGAFDTAGGKSSGTGLATWNNFSCGEQCDDGNGVDGDGCDSNCTVSGCGNGIAAGGEACDDGNAVNGDGCDNNCTVSGCGNGVTSPSTGEMCDDGNLLNGDGCESDCRITPRVQMVGAGGTLTTDSGSGATPEFPVQTSITTPNAGTVSIAPPAAPTAQEGVVVVGVQLQIDAPPATVAAPLVIVVTVDGSAIPPGVDPTRLDITRDGAVIEDCTGPAGTAAPDPCIQSRVLLAEGDVRITVLTSHASLWSVVVRGLSKNEQKCVNGMNLTGVKVARAQAKANATCLTAAAKGQESDAQGCLSADSTGKVGKALAKTSGVVAKKCGDIPPFGLTSADTVNAIAQPTQLTLMADVFGADLTASVINTSTNAAGSKCQAAALKSVQKVTDAETKAFLKCKKDGLKGKSALMVSSAQLAGCFTTLAADVDGKMQKAVDKLQTALTTKCAGVPLATALPGTCASAPDMTTCLAVRVKCRVCRLFNGMDGLTENCDGFDDGAVNGSCK